VCIALTQSPITLGLPQPTSRVQLCIMAEENLTFKPTSFWDGDLPWPDVLRTRRMELSGSLAKGTPEEVVRAICQSRLPTDETLPPTKSFEVHHIRGIDGASVPFTPIFSYLLDVGWDNIPTVHVPYSVAGNGAPDFPNFQRGAVMVTASFDSKDIIFPAVAGQIVFGVLTGTTIEQIHSEIGSFVGSIERIAPDTYSGSVRAFREAAICKLIKSQSPIVRYAELNQIQRLIDFKPGWRTDRIA
jgi:hypothetical protein